MTSISDTNVVNAPGGNVEVAFVQTTSDYITSATTVASATNMFASNATFIADGSPYVVDFACGRIVTNSGGPYTNVYLVDGNGNSQGMLGLVYPGGNQGPGFFRLRYVPTAGSVVSLNVRAIVNTTGNASYAAGTGGVSSSSQIPSQLRVSKVIQASQLIVQTPNAPLVTSLPSNAIDGQEVRYLADNTNGIVWNLRYRAGSSSAYKWEFIGGQPLYSFIATWEGTTTNYPNYTNLATSGPSLSVPLAGQYMVDLSYISQETNGGYSTTIVTQATGAPLDVANALFQIDATTADVQTSFTSRALTLTTTNPLRVLYARNGTGTANFGQRHLRFTPIRVSA